MAVVDLERPRYEVQMREGRVTVCTVLSSPVTECPISFSLSILAIIRVGMRHSYLIVIAIIYMCNVFIMEQVSYV